MGKLQLLVHQMVRLQVLGCQMEKLQVEQLFNLLDSTKPVLNI